MTDGLQTWSKCNLGVDGLVVMGMGRMSGDYVDVDFGMRAGENVGLGTVNDIQDTN